MSLDQVLANLGLGVTSNIIYGFLEKIFSENQKISKQELSRKISSFLNIQNADIYSEQIINLLAQNGDIKIEGSDIYARSILLSSSQGTEFLFGNNSKMETKSGSIIHAGQNASIKGRGNGRIEMDDKGNIKISA